jgi:small-conductance mechanosensitive channel
MRFLMTFCIGVAATLAWQAYGDQAREMVAGAYPQLGWLAPRAAAAQTAAAPARGADSQLQELSLVLAAMRQRVDQLSFQQEQMTRDLTAKVLTAERDILDKIIATQPKPEVTAAAPRRPATPPQTQSSQLR